MNETKEIDPRALGSITSGILLMQDFSKVHEAIEWIMGHPVWTHEIPSVRERCSALVKEQFSWSPLGPVPDWQATADFLLANYGPTVTVQHGSDERTASPVETLEIVAGGRPIIVTTGATPSTNPADRGEGL